MKLKNELHVKKLSTQLAVKMLQKQIGWGDQFIRVFDSSIQDLQLEELEIAERVMAQFGKKISAIVPSLGSNISGGARWFIEVLNRLSDFGFEVTAYLEKPPYSSDWLPASFVIKQFRNSNEIEGILLSSFSENENLFGDAKYATVKLYVVHAFEPAFIHRSRPSRIRAMQSYLRDDVWYMSVSHYLSTLMSEVFHRPVLPYLVSPGVDFEVFRYRAWELRGNEELKIGYLARSSSIRGTDIIEKISKLTCKRIPASFYGFSGISQGKLAGEYSKCHLFLDPSRVGGFMMPPLEAMACGTVPVATPLGSTTYILNGHNGFLVAKDHIDRFAFTIISAWENQEKMAEISHNARITAKQFTWKLTARNLLLNILSTTNTHDLANY